MPPAISPPTVTGGAFSSSSPSSDFGGDVVPQMLRDQFDQHLADQARLARARDAGHGGEDPQRKGGIELVEVIARDTPQAEPALGRGGACGWARKWRPKR